MAREINAYNRLRDQDNLRENLPSNYIRAVQYFTFLDLVCDGAEIEGFATPSANGVAIPTSLFSPLQVDVENQNLIIPFQSNETYDIRRVIERANSTGVAIQAGNETLISDVLNVYTDSNVDGYVASNSLPSYDIDINVTKETIVGAANTNNFDGQNPLNNLYSFIRFTPSANSKLKLIQGDAIVYQPDTENIV